jgi:hypothetical protein
MDRIHPNWASAAAAPPKALESFDYTSTAAATARHDSAMLSRRLFRQLTDSALLEPGLAPVLSFCVAARCAVCCPAPRNAASVRHSSSSTRWKSRQGSDFFAKEARVQGLKSRAAFKLLEVGQYSTHADTL